MTMQNTAQRDRRPSSHIGMHHVYCMSVIWKEVRRKRLNPMPSFRRHFAGRLRHMRPRDASTTVS